MIWSQLRAVLRKETWDAARDKRSLMTVLSYVVLAPLVLPLAFAGLADKLDQDNVLEVASLNHDLLPGLDAAMREANIVLKPRTDPVAMVEAGTAPAGLIVEQQADLHSGRPARVTVVTRASELDGGRASGQVVKVLAGYGAELTTLRALARGMSPAVMQPIQVETLDLSSSAEHAALLLSGFQVFILLAAFIGSMNLVIDMTAGERERRSMEILLAQGAPASVLVVGKWLVASAFAALAILLTIGMLAMIVPTLPLSDLGITTRPDQSTFIWMAVAGLPLAPLAASLQMMAASFAKTFKEAQMYLSIIMMAPLALMMAAEFLRPEPADWMFTVPMLGQQQLMTAALKDAVPHWGAFGVAAVCVLVPAALLCWVTICLHRREAILRTS